MNRRQIAQHMKLSSMRVDNGDGTHTVYAHMPEWQVREESLKGSIYCYTAPGATISTAPAIMELWTHVSWRELLKVIRSAYPRFTGIRCDHKHESGARCIWDVGDHNHCKKCGQAHMLTHLCFTCQTDADKVRLDLTRQMAQYYNTFGLTFQKDEETYDHMTGAFDDYDDLPRSRGDREDFHADG